MNNRIERVGELLKQELSKLIKAEISEDYGIITVTDVIVGGDFKEAKVFISCFDKIYEQKVVDELKKHKLQFQQYLGRNLTMKFTPRLEFMIDKNQDKVEEIEKILQEIKE